jgi:hypothetical protein
MNRTEFQAELQRLRRESGAGQDNAGSFQSTGCEGCLRCMFCTGCRNCYRCTHCRDCEALTISSHCLRCTSCHECSHCEDSEACTGSAYLVHCFNCNDCTYCYGCVGLSKKEFHILNVPYSRTEYFKIVKQLSAQR